MKRRWICMAWLHLWAAICASSATREISPDALAQLEVDQQLDGGPVSRTIAELYKAHEARDSRGVWALWDAELKRPYDLEDDQVLKLLPRQLPAEPRLLKVECVVPPGGLETREWLLEAIVRFGSEGEYSYAIWYFVRRGEVLYLRTVPFLKGPGKRLDGS